MRQNKEKLKNREPRRIDSIIKEWDKKILREHKKKNIKKSPAPKQDS